MTDYSDIPEGFEATELGVLPVDWDVVKIIDVVDFTKKPRSLSINPDQILPFIPMEMIPANNDSVSRWQEKKNSEISSGTFVFKGDLIVAKITPCFENGKQAILDNLPTDYAYTTTEVWPMHPKEDQISIDFLSNYLRNPIIRKELTTKMEGSTNRQRLPREALQNLFIPLPHLPEQHAIATTLRTVREAKEKTDDVIVATKALMAAMMKHLFTYGPVSTGEAERVALKETEIGSVPEDWDILQLGNIINESIINGAFVKRDNFGEGVPFLNVADIYRNIRPDFNTVDKVKVLKKEIERFKLDQDDLIYVRSSLKREGIAHCCIIKAPPQDSIFDCHLMRVRVNKKIILPEYLAYFSLYDNSRRQLISLSKTTTMTTINQQNLSNFLISIPPLPIQNRIATILTSIDQKLAAEQSRKEALDTLFTSLLHDLMTAKIRVSTA